MVALQEDSKTQWISLLGLFERGPQRPVSSARKPNQIEAERALKPTRMQKFKSTLPWGRVSKVHLQAAKERYITLSRRVQYYKGHYQNSMDPEKQQRAALFLPICEEILDNISDNYLKRNEEFINFAWRELTRVHIIIIEHLLTSEHHGSELDAAREEAFRLGVAEDPQVKDHLQQLAEFLDESGGDETKTKRVTRLLKALRERYTTLRTSKMHQQFLNIWVYKLALLALVLISVVIIDNNKLILPQADSKASQAASLAMPIAQPVLPQKKILALASDKSMEPALWEKVIGAVYSGVGGVIGSCLAFLNNLFGTNTLAFVYLAGLTGGFFSVANRVRNQDIMGGDDAYAGWYVLTKPLVGALGAMIVYILFVSDFINLELVKNVAAMEKSKIFGIAFLSGFSERFVFPNLR